MAVRFLILLLAALIPACSSPAPQPDAAPAASRATPDPRTVTFQRREPLGLMLRVLSRYDHVTFAWFNDLSPERQAALVTQLNAYTLVLRDAILPKADNGYGPTWRFVRPAPVSITVEKKNPAASAFTVRTLSATLQPAPPIDNDLKTLVLELRQAAPIIIDLPAQWTITLPYRATKADTRPAAHRAAQLSCIAALAVTPDGHAVLTAARSKSDTDLQFSLNGEPLADTVTASPGDAIYIVFTNLLGTGGHWYVYQGAQGRYLRFEEHNTFYDLEPESVDHLEVLPYAARN